MHWVATIGYEGLTPERFVRALQDAGVRRLVDVRAIAASRRPGFAKTALRENLAAAGIEYEHVRTLGTPAEGRAANKAGRMAEFRRIYAARLASPEAEHALASLAARCADVPSCLMCLEADPLHCHRAMVADRLAQEHGFAVRHLHAETMG
jgi:uncharacterized protein (DUF488 family)